MHFFFYTQVVMHLFLFAPRDGNDTCGFRSPSGFAPDVCGCGIIFPPVGLPKPDPGIFGCGFRFRIAPAGDLSVARNQSNIKYFC
jgi:hypothetical protein